MRSPGSASASSPTTTTATVDTNSDSIDRSGPSSRAYRLNKPVAVAHRRKFTDRRAWSGDKPTDHQQRELDDLRRYESAKNCDELPDLRRSISASTILGLKNAGKAHAYRLSLAQWRELGLDGDDCYYARAYLAWVLCAQLGHGNEWLIPRHVDMAAIIECCETYAARASRELVARGLVRRQPLYGSVTVTTTDGARSYRRHVRGPSAFRVPATVLDRIGIRELSTDLPGEKYQASEIQPSRFNPDLRGDRVLSTPTPIIDAPSVPCTSTAANSYASQPPSVEPTRTTTGPLADESSCSATHSASALVPVAPSEEAPREVVSDDEPPASSTRRAAHLQRTLGEHMDRLQASSSRLVDAARDEFERAARSVKLAFDSERARLMAAAIRYAADTRPRSVAEGLQDTFDRAAYERELAARRELGRALPDEKQWLAERKLGLCVLVDENGGDS